MTLAARTNSEKIESAEREIVEQKHLLKQLQGRYELEVGLLKSDATELRTKNQELSMKIGVLETRHAQVEKLIDEVRNRLWQVWLAFLGAVLSAAIALVVALAKK